MSNSATQSKPSNQMVHGKLEARPGKAHLIVADAVGAEAILDMAKSAPAEMLAHTHLIYIPKSSGDTYNEKLKALGAAQLYIGPSYEATLPRLRKTLSDAHMGLQVYLAGTESIIGQTMREATDAGIPHTAIQTEHRGSTARRMQCVHCKGITEDVTHDPFQCAHCGLHLFVRDHYSRRIAAYQAVRVDAEDPGNIPEPVERFK